ncbi:segregation/condensation protein A [Jeotgalibaca sp. MA1X17-3]|uniref:segregation and condensation protein A n=1 Tax=Jeotgalibaca sp. MA1X17-3 TaxID=2908211 RepID=UPI001F20C3D9|nr:segregation/condensation protein A [Jeotgalibaca sp. MA1X17-3]UJF14851.1 segregation/condensation protein A [Jeotgalibaca sp. MA1X17-3]
MNKQSEALTIYLESFEGPLDLLLHLIKDLKVDVFDIPMADLTQQYLNYLHTMKELKLDIAGEYLLMAATLLEIKSRMLLPKKEVEVDDDSFELEEDPRDELVHQLLEYKQMQEAAKVLKEMQTERGQFYTKSITNLESHQQSVPLVPGEVSTEDLLHALQKMQQKIQRKQPMSTRVHHEKITIEATMDVILNRLTEQGKPGFRIAFTDFFESTERPQIVNTFLAMLELVRERKIFFTQTELYGEIFLELFSEG